MPKIKNCTKSSLKNLINKKRLSDFKITTKGAIVNKKPLNELTDSEQISIVSDAMFKTMLASTDRKKFDAKILAGYFKCSFDEIYNNLEYYKNELDKEAVDSKGERTDLILKFGDDYILIEMNNRDETLRNIEYSDNIYNTKIKVGSEYIYPKVLVINLNNFYFEGHTKPIDEFYVQNDDGELLVDKIYLQIYIPLLVQKWYNEGDESLDDLEKSIIVMSITERDKALELAKGDTILEEYVNEAKEVERNNKLLKGAYDHEYSQVQAAEMRGEENGLAEGLTQGRAEGLAKARKETIESIKKLIKSGIDKTILINNFNLTEEEQKLLD